MNESQTPVASVSQEAVSGPVRGEAERFITALTGSLDASVTFQTYTDGEEEKTLKHGWRTGSNGKLIDPRASKLHGTLAEHWTELVRRNQRGAGIFLMINEGDGRGRRAENVRALRAFFIDDDKGQVDLSSLPLEPSIVVRSCRGPHAYWRVKDGEALMTFTPMQIALASALGTDGSVKDLPRVMRIPGFLHQKDPSAPFFVKVERNSTARYSSEELRRAFGLHDAPEVPAVASNSARPSKVDPRAAEPTKAVSLKAIEGAREALRRLGPSIELQQGDNRGFRAGAIVRNDFALSFETGLLLLREWNKTCRPEWPENDLLRFLANGASYGKHPRGESLPLSAEDVIVQLDSVLTKGPLTREVWRPLMFGAQLEAADQERVLEHLVSLGLGGKRALSSEWKLFLKDRKQVQKKGAVEQRRAAAVGRGKVVLSAGQEEEQVVRAAERVLVDAADPELPLMRDSNGYVRPVADRPDWATTRDGRPVPTIAMLRSYDEAAMRWLLDRYVTLESPPDEDGEIKVLRPDDYARRLLEHPLPSAPRVRGLITHPLVRANGSLVETPGLDAETGLYLHLGGDLGRRPDFLAPAIPVPEDPEEAQELAARFAKELLSQYDDYRFESEIDRVVALSARLGILVRKDLDISPAYLLVGPERGTGKTTLAAIDHVIATGHDIAVARLEDDEEKAKQTLFAAFVSSPAAVLFDNLPADSSFSSGVLAAALTKGYVEARMFHTQLTGRATTNLSIYFTGNAVVLDEDLQARTLEVRFSPERPKRWSHPDWLAHARATREETRTKLQYLQRAHAAHGRETRGVYVRFEAWGRRVRDPLLWAGLPDVGIRLQQLEDNNPNRAADAAVLSGLSERFGTRRFTAGELATAMGAGAGDCQSDFAELKAMLQERRPAALGKSGAQVIAGYFREHLRRWFTVEARRLRLAETTEKGMARWRVEVEGLTEDFLTAG